MRQGHYPQYLAGYAIDDAVGKATKWQATKSPAPYRAEPRMRLEQRNRAFELCDEVFRQFNRSLPSIKHRTVDKLICGQRMRGKSHRIASRARAMATSTGIPTTEPLSSSTRRRSASADQAASISASGLRLANNLSAKYARSAADNCSACASNSMIDMDTIRSNQNTDCDDTPKAGSRGNHRRQARSSSLSKARPKER